MWELDYKESWAPKNWCFWTVVLEKTLKNLLDCEETQPVIPKGNQSWVFIESWTMKKAKRWRIDAFELWCWRRLLRVPWTARRLVLSVHWKDWCWSWNSNTLATWCKELTHLKRPWCWERLRARGDGSEREWDGWMASLTQWTWVWVNSGSWWWTGRPDMLLSLGSQRVRHDWVAELNWTIKIPLT